MSDRKFFKKGGRAGLWNAAPAAEPPKPVQPEPTPPLEPPPEHPVVPEPEKAPRPPVQVDLVRELSSFAIWLKSNPLKGTAQALWMNLMEIGIAQGMPEWFDVPNVELLVRLCATDKTLDDHRKQLVALGRIEYEGRQRSNKGGKYKINLFHPDGEFPVKNPVDFPVEIPTEENIPVEIPVDSSTIGNSAGESTGKNPADSFALISKKIDRRIDGSKEGETRVYVPDSWKPFVDNFESQFNIEIGAQHVQMINSYIEDGLPFEVIALAMEDAVQNEAQYPKYLWTILNGLLDNEVKTVRDYRDYMRSWQEMQQGQQQAAAGGGGGKGRGYGKRPGTGKASGGTVVDIAAGRNGWLGK